MSTQQEAHTCCAGIDEAVARVHLVDQREVVRVVVGLVVSRAALKGEGELPAVVEVHHEHLLQSVLRAAAAIHQRADARVDVQRVRQVLRQIWSMRYCILIFDRRRDLLVANL